MSGLRLGIAALALLLLLQVAAAVLLRDQGALASPVATAARIERVVRLLQVSPRGDHALLARGAGASGLVAVVTDTPRRCVAAPDTTVRRTIAAAARRMPGRAICAVPDRRLQASITGDRWLLVTLPPPPPVPWPPGVLLALTAAAIAVIALVLVTRDAIAIARLGRGMETFRPDAPRPVRPGGSREIRKLTGRFNDLQARIIDLTRDRAAHWSGVSHDIGTLLTRIALRIDAHGDAGLRDRIDNDMAALHRILANGREWANLPQVAPPVAFDPLPIITDVVAAFDGVACDLPPSATIPHVVGDPSAFERVLINLIDNADRHAGGAQVTCGTSSGRVIVSVADHGPGLTEEQRASLANGAHADGQGSTSGLAVAGRLARASGMSLASVHAAGGHRIAITLPCHGSR